MKVVIINKKHTSRKTHIFFYCQKGIGFVKDEIAKWTFTERISRLWIYCTKGVRHIKSAELSVFWQGNAIACWCWPENPLGNAIAMQETNKKPLKQEGCLCFCTLQTMPDLFNRKLIHYASPSALPRWINLMKQNH